MNCSVPAIKNLPDFILGSYTFGLLVTHYLIGPNTGYDSEVRYYIMDSIAEVRTFSQKYVCETF